MKTLIITSFLALGVAAPAVADTSGLSLNQIAQVHLQAGNESANDRNTFFGNERIKFSASNAHNDRAAKIFADLKAASQEDE